MYERGLAKYVRYLYSQSAERSVQNHSAFQTENHAASFFPTSFKFKMNVEGGGDTPSRKRHHCASMVEMVFHKDDWSPILAYINSNMKWNKNTFVGEALCGVDMLSLLMPLMMVRTVGFLKRKQGVASMPSPFDKARIPNFQPFLDRLTLVTYPRIKALQLAWREHLDEQAVRSRMLCIMLIVTQLDLHYVLRLFSSHYEAIVNMDVEALIPTICSFFKIKGQCSLFRSRFQTVSMEQFPELLRAFASCNVPHAQKNGGFTVAAFSKWLQRKEGGKKVFLGIGPFHPMVFARELVLYGFFPVVGSLTDLGASQGSRKLFVELNLQPGFDNMRRRFSQSAKQAWGKHAQMHPEDAKLLPSVARLLFRTPTDFELENMCCEGRKMLKALLVAMNTNDARCKEESEKRKRVKTFRGIDNAPPPMNGVPLPCVEGDGVKLNVADLIVDQL